MTFLLDIGHNTTVLLLLDSCILDALSLEVSLFLIIPGASCHVGGVLALFAFVLWGLGLVSVEGSL